MARESSFWNWLRGHLAPLGHFTRIESEISPGVPDVYFALKTVDHYDGWIELKSLKAPKRDTARPLKRRGLRPEQVDWIDKHAREGVRVFIFVKLGSYVYTFRGSMATKLNNMTLGEIKAFSDYTIPLRRPQPWTRSEFLKALIRSPGDPRYSFPSKDLMRELKRAKVKPILLSHSTSRR